MLCARPSSPTLTCPVPGPGPGARHNDGMDDRNDSSHQIDAAMAVRRLAHALVAHEATDTVLSRIAEDAHRWAAEVEQHPRLVRGPGALRTDRSGGPPPDGAPIEHFDR